MAMGCNSSGHVAESNRSILLCTDNDIHPAGKEDTIWAQTPVRCLSVATENRYDMIVLYISAPTLIKARPLIELCCLLKKNRHTRDCPLTVLCFSVNRQVVEQLTAAGADFIVFKENLKAIDAKVEPGAFINQLTQENRPHQVLERLCPYIDYNPINEDKELITCRAYANWLVLGPRKLKQLCETAGHLNCPYYESPRLPKQDPGIPR